MAIGTIKTTPKFSIHLNQNTFNYGWHNDQIIKGIVVNKNKEGTTINIEGNSFFSQVNVDEEIGETVHFRVSKEKGSKLRLKYMPKGTLGGNNQGCQMGLKAILNNRNISKDEWSTQLAALIDRQAEGNTEEARVAKQQLNALMNKITEEDIKKLSTEKYNPMKMTLEDLFNQINSNKKNTEVLELEEEDWLDSKVKKYEQIYGSGENVKAIIKKLKAHNLPINIHNIEKVKEVVNKIDGSKGLDDFTIAHLVRSKTSLTIDQLYRAQYSSGKSKGSTPSDSYSEQHVPITDEQFDALEPQVRRLLENNGFEVNEQTLKAAKLLLKNDIPVDKPYIEKVVNLLDIEDRIDLHYIIDEAVKCLAEDKPIGEIPLFRESMEGNIDTRHTKQIVDRVEQYKDEHLYHLIKSNKALTIKNLELLPKTIEVPIELNQLGQEQRESFTEAKIHLEEIRLKMTYDSALKLSRNQIDIENESLDKLVQNLRQLEKQVYASKLQEVGAANTEDNVQKLSDTVRIIDQVNKAPAAVLGRVLSNHINFSLGELHSEGQQIIEALIGERAQTMYEALGTKPRRDMGDSIIKAYEQLDQILKEQNIEVTDENIRAAKILAYNELEINESNINHIKLLDQKVNRVLRELHPTIIANMIKDDFTPVDIAVDEVLEYMEQFNEYIGEDLTDKISSYILQLEKQNQLSPEERQGLIGIYRMLNVISKSEGRAVGFLIKNDMPLTLNNLMEAAKYLKTTGGKRTKIDVNIDQVFGYLSQLKVNDKNISEQIKQAFEQAKLEYTKSNVSSALALEEMQVDMNQDNLIQGQSMEENIKELIQVLDVDEMLNFIAGNEDYGDIPIEEIVEELQLVLENKQEIMNSKINLLDQIQQLTQMKEAVFSEMAKYDVPLTMNNLLAVQAIMDKPFELSNRLEKVLDNLDNDSKEEIHSYIEQLFDTFEDLDIQQLNTGIEEYINELKTELMLKKDTSTDLMEAVDSILDVLKLEGTVQRKQGYYQIPIITEENISQLNMYILNDNMTKEQIVDEGISVILALKTNELGTVRMFAHQQGESISLNIACDQQENSNYIKQYETRFTQLFESLGYNVTSIEYNDPAIKEPFTTSQPNSSQILKYDTSNYEALI